tara:strand:+ start:1254 stop:1526 length:273 start_codon:yes stop_codon:yes gene_type:complete
MKTHKPIYTDVTVASLYHFAAMRDLELKRSSLKSMCEEQNILGVILLATEGVNGTIAGEYDISMVEQRPFQKFLSGVVRRWFTFYRPKGD